MAANVLTRLRLVAPIAVSLALAACAMPLQLAAPDTVSKAVSTKAAAVHGSGAVSLVMHWPDRAGRSTQAMPYRTAKAVITLTNRDQHAPVDASGKTIAPVTVQRGAYGTMQQDVSLRWEFVQQEDMHVSVELYDEHDALIGSATNDFDVIAGYTSYVSLDVQLADAPTLDEVYPSEFHVGDTVTLTGSNFGATEGYDLKVFFETHGAMPGDGNGSFDSGMPTYRIPDQNVTRVSDTEIQVTIPDMRDQLFSYFYSSYPLYLAMGVMVDGVRAVPVEVSMPRKADLSVNVNVTEGEAAPDQGPSSPESLDLTDELYAVPTRAGTTWEYAITQPGQQGSSTGPNRLMIQRTSDPDVYRETSFYSSTQSYTNDGHISYDYGDQGLFARIDAARSLQHVGQEPWTDEHGQEMMADRLFYTLKPNGEGVSSFHSRDVWVVKGVGVVKVVDHGLYANGDQLYHVDRMYQLVHFDTPSNP